MQKKLLYVVLALLPCSLLAQNNKLKNSEPSVPGELIGHWQLGTFSLTNFWNPATGQYAGNAGEASRSYRIAADGTAEEFFIYNSTTYNCRTQILGYRKGKLQINTTAKSFTFCPTSGYYRTANCFNKDWKRKEYSGKDLCPQYNFTAYWTVQNGNLIVKESSTAGTGSTYKRIDAADK